MKTQNKSAKSTQTSKTKKRAVRREVAGATAGAAAGAAVGAVVGAVAGPPGIAVGAALGAAVGAVAEGAIERDQQERHDQDARLDEEIGVAGGDLGSPRLRHPAPRVGAYSDASVGATRRAGRTPAEGPIPEPDED